MNVGNGTPTKGRAPLVPYPSSPGDVDSLVRATSFQDLKNELTRYGNQRYNLDTLKNWIKPVATWAARYNVVVVCNEFSSYKARAPRKSRLNWIGDIRKAFEANQIPWAMWEYDEGFGWIEYAGNGRRQPKIDTEVLRALGL